MLPASEFPPISLCRAGNAVPEMGCAHPDVLGVQQKLALDGIKEEKRQNLSKGTCSVVSSLSQSITSLWYFRTSLRYGNESACLAQKLFSAFKWERDGKGEEGLSSSKALSTLGFFLPISHCCLHGCSSICGGTANSSGHRLRSLYEP